MTSEQERITGGRIDQGGLALTILVPVVMAGIGVSRSLDRPIDPLAAPFEIMAATVVEPFALAGELAGVTGQVALGAVLLLWALFFIDPIVRGPI